MKHGLLAADLVVRGEDPVEFAGVLENLVDELQPQGLLEAQLVERVAACMWRLRRLYRVEAGIFTHESLTIEMDRAKKEVKSSEKDEDERMSAMLKNVHITDGEQHERATATAEKTWRSLV